MIAYKGFSERMTGHGGYQFTPGATYREENAKTVRSGFHCAENPLVCLTYFPLDGRNRFWQVEATGSIDEDSEERIA